MSSPCGGERTGACRRFCLLLAVVLFVSCCSATTATLGIDWGEEFVKVSIAFRGHRPDILLTSSGSRKFQNVVYLSGETRLFDKEASAYALRDPAKTFQKSAHILGIPFQGPSWSKFSTLRVGEVLDKFQRNNISFNWDYTPYEFAVAKDGQLHLKLLKDANVSVEEVYGHFFHHIKTVALEKLHSAKIITSLDSNVELLAVIAIPCNYTQNQRKAIAFAAESAGLKVVDLVHGITAAALLHSLEMQPGTKRVLFYDMGSSAANVGVVEIFVPTASKTAHSGAQNPSIRTLSCVTVPGVGGRQHDYLLSEHLRASFESHHSIKLVPKHLKALQKLTRAVNKAKATLSISNTATLEVENLVPDKTLRETLSRSSFEELLKPVVEKLGEAVPKALELAGLDKVDSVEVIGGSWRVPVVQKKIADTVAPHQLGFHLNAEEAIAMGAGYLGAAHNPFFRMKKVDIMDNCAFEYSLEIRSKGGKWTPIKKVVLHTHSSKLSASKTVKLKAHQDLEVVLLEADTPIAHYKVTGIDAFLKSNPGKVAEVSLVFRVNLGLVKLDQTFAVVKDASAHIEDVSERSEDEAGSESQDKAPSDQREDGSKEATTVEPGVPEAEKVVEKPAEGPKESEKAAETTKEDAADSQEDVSKNATPENLSKEDEKSGETPEESAKSDTESAEPTDKMEVTKESTGADSTDGTADSVETPGHPEQHSTDHTSSHSTKAHSDHPTDHSTDTKETQKKKEVPKEKRTVLLFSVTQSGVYDGPKLESCRNGIEELVKRDKDFYERSEAKNSLESLLYKYESKVRSSDFKNATTEEVYTKFSARIEELLTWFDDHSSSATLEQFNEITKELNDVATPILVRAGHNSDRESVIRSTDKELNDLRAKYDVLVAEKPYLLEHHGIINTFTNVLEWWEQVKKDQAARPLNEDPLFTSETVKPKRSAAKLALKTLEAIKPKVVEKPAEGPKESEKAAETTKEDAADSQEDVSKNATPENLSKEDEKSGETPEESAKSDTESAEPTDKMEVTKESTGADSTDGTTAGSEERPEATPEDATRQQHAKQTEL